MNRFSILSFYPFFNLDTRWGEWSTTRFGRFNPGKATLYPFYRRLGESQGLSGRVRKISLPPGFDPRTVQPVASGSTNYGILITMKSRRIMWD
jgi:hypothetical protein